MRQIQITIPNEKLREVLDALLEYNVKGIHTITGETDSLMIFRIQTTRVPDVIEKLNSIGVGVVTGIIDILEVKATVPPLESLTAKEEQDIKSKVPVEELYLELVSNSELTYKFIMFSLLAALLAGFGLVYNNSIVIIAAMVLAPLLGPILALSYAFVVKDRNLIKLAMKAEFIGFIIALTCGIILGIIFITIVPVLRPWLFRPFLESDIFTTVPYELWVPNEILSRGQWDFLVVNVIYAFIMGIAVGFSLTEGIQGNIVGIAIGASILPPIVNTGICFAIFEFGLALVSSIIFLINFFVITITSIIIFHIKKIRAPIKTYFLWRGPRLPQEKIEEEPPSVVSRIFGRFRRKKPDEKKKVKKVPRKERKKGIKAAKMEDPKLHKEIKEVVKEAIKEEIKKDTVKGKKGKKKTEKLEKDMKKEIQKEVKKAVKEAIIEEVKKTPTKEDKDALKLEKDEIKEVIKEAIKEEIKKGANNEEKEAPKIEKEEIKEVIKEVIKEEIKKDLKKNNKNNK
ncbi:MAG: TIGR00341 family protein [Candidatus Helarchaeota archaeon]|nr:TIGR00341 family protein [Candidatus Helarchaeota archaeon]